MNWLYFNAPNVQLILDTCNLLSPDHSRFTVPPLDHHVM